VINAVDDVDDRYPITRYFRYVRENRENSRFAYSTLCRTGVIDLAQTIYRKDKHFANNATSELDYRTVENIADLFDSFD